jgi:hypothetical protein
MNSLRYEDNEIDFLEATAIRLGFTTEKCKFVFVQRFLQANDDLENKELAEVFEPQLTKDSSDAGNTLRDCLKAIYKKLEGEGCNSKGATTDKLPIAKSWLRDTVYPKWLKEHLWEQLKATATPTNKMGPVLAELATLGMRRKYLKTVPLGSEIKFHVNLDREGYLILLEREPSGILCCLCPSEYAPKSRCPAGLTVLPQPSSLYFGADEEGCEQILALITQELPPIDWLPKGSEEPLELSVSHLNELLEYLNYSPDSKVLYAEYMVTSIDGKGLLGGLSDV